MSTRVTNSLKKQVAERAGYCCEYCKLRESTSFFTFHVDHILSQKHGGLTILPNLAYGCPDCNYFKGSDVATILDEERTTRFLTQEKTCGTSISTFLMEQFMASLTLELQPPGFSNLMKLND